VQLPVGYARCWASDEGYVLSHDPGFDPRPGSTREWRLMEQLGG
jgi:hypothetical protein